MSDLFYGLTKGTLYIVIFVVIACLPKSSYLQNLPVEEVPEFIQESSEEKAPPTLSSTSPDGSINITYHESSGKAYLIVNGILGNSYNGIAFYSLNQTILCTISPKVSREKGKKTK